MSQGHGPVTLNTLRSLLRKIHFGGGYILIISLYSMDNQNYTEELVRPKATVSNLTDILSFDFLEDRGITGHYYYPTGLSPLPIIDTKVDDELAFSVWSYIQETKTDGETFSEQVVDTDALVNALYSHIAAVCPGFPLEWTEEQWRSMCLVTATWSVGVLGSGGPPFSTTVDYYPVGSNSFPPDCYLAQVYYSSPSGGIPTHLMLAASWFPGQFDVGDYTSTEGWIIWKPIYAICASPPTKTLTSGWHSLEVVNDLFVNLAKIPVPDNGPDKGKVSFKLTTDFCSVKFAVVDTKKLDTFPIVNTGVDGVRLNFSASVDGIIDLKEYFPSSSLDTTGEWEIKVDKKTGELTITSPQ